MTLGKLPIPLGLSFLAFTMVIIRVLTELWMNELKSRRCRCPVTLARISWVGGETQMLIINYSRNANANPEAQAKI